jgi:hypothetical protein
VPTVAGGAVPAHHSDAAARQVPTNAAPGAPRSGACGELALDFCREQRDALAAILATRSTQTNEVNRCAALLPALLYATPRGHPLRLVELGASAGLNLLVDRYDYDYRTGGDANDPRLTRTVRITPRVVCACSLHGDLPPLARPPIAERVGVDLAPVDLRDEDAARWLLACVWPDEADRVARLRAAIELARTDPPTVVRGDALLLLPALVDPAGIGVHPVIWHSWVLAYWTPAAQHELTRAIDALGATRDLTWLYLEQPSETPGLPMPVAAATDHDPDDSALVAVTYRDGRRTVVRLGDAHPHAHSMRWFGEG